jgi:hypothetical protein
MKLTAFILALPIVALMALFWCLLDLDTSDALRMLLLVVYLASSVFCFGWGFYISRRSHFLGWLCVAIGGVLPLILILWPVHARIEI